MTLVRRAIHDQVAAAIAAEGLAVELLNEGALDLGRRTAPTAILQEGPDVVLSIESAAITRQVSGTVHLADVEDGDAAAVRAANDAMAIAAEKALLGLAVTINAAVPGTREFNLSEYSPRMLGEDGGAVSARVSWTCSYSHLATDPETGL